MYSMRLRQRLLSSVNICAKYRSKDDLVARNNKPHSRSSMRSSRLAREKNHPVTRQPSLRERINRRSEEKGGEGVAIVSAIMRKGQTQFVASQRIINRLGTGYATTGACAERMHDDCAGLRV